MKLRRQQHCVYYTRYHLIFPTKYGRNILKSGMGEYLTTLMRAIIRRHPEIEVVEVNCDKDHVHLLIGLAPKMAVSEAVGILKSITARQKRKKFTYLDVVYAGNTGIWSDGYFVSTVGVEEAVNKIY